MESPFKVAQWVFCPVGSASEQIKLSEFLNSLQKFSAELFLKTV